MHRITWFEIPTKDLDRAETFYGTVLNVKLTREKMGDMGEMAVFPHGDGEVSGSLTCGPNYEPSPSGTIVYIYVDEPLEGVLQRIDANGGKTVMPPMDLGDIGFIALFSDTEGNTVGLHTSK